MNLHKLPQGFIVTSDEVVDDILTLEYSLFIEINGKYYSLLAQEPNIILSSLSEAEQNAIGWFDVQKLAELQYEDTIFGSEALKEVAIIDFKKGFRKCESLLSDRRFTEKDMIEFACNVYNYYYDINKENSFRGTAETFIQSLTHQSWKIEAIEEDGKIKVLKLL